MKELVDKTIRLEADYRLRFKNILFCIQHGTPEDHKKMQQHLDYLEQARDIYDTLLHPSEKS